MIKNNKLKVIISSVIILLPILFGLIMWNELPDVITTHWGADGNADGVGGKAFAVFGLPIILFVMNFVCLLLTSLDKKQKDQSKKALGMIFWIMPIISLFANGIIYCAAFGKVLDFSLFMPIVLGVMLLLLGNYLPKIKQNRTLGIKISWTLNNEENWNKTHRFAGKLWVIGGLVVLFSAFLPLKAMVYVTVIGILCVVIAPVIYSYTIYKKHKKEGIVYAAENKSKAEKVAVKISTVVLVIILIGVAILMFTGSVSVRCEDTLNIDATYWTDLDIEYSAINTVEYRKDIDVGIRTSGYASAKLSLGLFQNDEFGSYTLYAYTGADEFIVLTSEDKTLVIGLKDENEAQAIYDSILEKTNK